MIPELGHFALILSLFVALALGVLTVIGGQTGRSDWIALARPGAHALWLLTAIAYGCLTYAFYSNDFSVVYVVQHSNSSLPALYRIAGVWGGHEGSLLLWHFMLTSWMLAVAFFSRQLPDAMVARVLGILGLVWTDKAKKEGYTGDKRTIAFVLSLVATIYPSWRASRVNPAEALRYE